MRAMVLIVLLAAGCSASTPPRTTDAPVDNDACLPVSGWDHDAPPMGDEICLSNEQFDTLADFTCPSVKAAACPAVEVTCEDAPVTVTCECPSVEVTCEPEIVEVPIGIPTFFMFDPGIIVDPSTKPDTSFRLMTMALIGGDHDARIDTLGFRLVRQNPREGEDYGGYQSAGACDVLDCSSIALYSDPHAFDDVLVVINSGPLDDHGVTYNLVTDHMEPTLTGSDYFATPPEWEGYDLPANARHLFGVFARVRADARPGRYHLIFQTYQVEYDGVLMNIPGLYSYGMDFTVAEDTDNTPTCVEQPSVRVWGLSPQGPSTDTTRKLVTEIRAGDCDLRLDRLQVGIRAVVDYDGGGGEEWAVYNGSVTTLLDEYSAAIGNEHVTNSIGLIGVPALDASLQTGEDFVYVIPAYETALFTVYAAMRDDAPTGRYLFSLEAVESRIANTGDAVQINGMPIHGQQFEM